MCTRRRNRKLGSAWQVGTYLVFISNAFFLLYSNGQKEQSVGIENLAYWKNGPRVSYSDDSNNVITGGYVCSEESNWEYDR